MKVSPNIHGTCTVISVTSIDIKSCVLIKRVGTLKKSEVKTNESSNSIANLVNEKRRINVDNKQLNNS